MRYLSDFMKRALSALFCFSCFFILPACNAKPIIPWQWENMEGCSEACSSRRIILSPQDKRCSLIETELLFVKDKKYLYFNVFGLQLPVCPEDAAKVNGVVFIANESFEISAERLCGGQKALVNENDAEFIIDALLDGHNVNITLGRFYTELSADGFKELYNRLLM